MNHKSLLLASLLGLLLLIPAGLVTPRGNATQHVVPSLYVNPPDTRFNGPCLVSTMFSIDVVLWNNPLSLIANPHADVYAFDFDISWASITTISLVNATYHSPWANYFVIANGNTTNPATDWHLAMTAMSPSTGLSDVNQSVLTLVFHINTDVCYPTNMTGSFTLTLNAMSGDGTVPMAITNAEIDSGTYEQYSVQPNIDLTTTDAAYNATTNTITEKCVSHTFDIEVDLTNITDVYGFSFIITYCPCHLETDPQHITFKAAFPPPYETFSVTPATGQICIALIRPSEKPAVCGSVVPAVDIVFHTIDATDGKGIIPTTSLSNISITAAQVLAKCPCYTEYDYGFTTSTTSATLLYGGNLAYYFKPNPHDLNLDCVVDVQDMTTLLPYYGKTTVAGGYGDLSTINGGHFVDIFDFVAIAKNFGPVDP